MGLGKVLQMHIHLPGSGKCAPDEPGIPGSFVVDFPGLGKGRAVGWVWVDLGRFMLFCCVFAPVESVSLNPLVKRGLKVVHVLLSRSH